MKCTREGPGRKHCGDSPLPPIARIRINDARSHGNRVIITYYETAHPGLLVDCRNRRPAGTAADTGLGRDESGGGEDVYGNQGNGRER